jgi:hypothetical protein
MLVGDGYRAAMETVIERAAALWCGLTGVRAAFEPGTITVVTAPIAQTAPPGWIGAIRLGDAALMTAPTPALADAVRDLVGGLRPAEICEPRVIFAGDRPTEILGPTTLSYLDAARFRPVDGAVAAIAVGPEIEALETAAGDADADEAAVGDVMSPVFVTRSTDGSVTSACGYRIWGAGVAHMCILTHPDHRGRGLAKVVGSAATAHALSADLLPQWRAIPPASIAIARSLGYTMIGAQLSFHLPTPG